MNMCIADAGILALHALLNTLITVPAVAARTNCDTIASMYVDRRHAPE